MNFEKSIKIYSIEQLLITYTPAVENSIFNYGKLNLPEQGIIGPSSIFFPEMVNRFSIIKTCTTRAQVCLMLLLI
jgi:hypothetical protein